MAVFMEKPFPLMCAPHLSDGLSLPDSPPGIAQDSCCQPPPHYSAKSGLLIPSSRLTTVARLLREHLVKHSRLQLQDAPELLVGGVVLEVQVSGGVQSLLGTEKTDLVEVILLADV